MSVGDMFFDWHNVIVRHLFALPFSVRLCFSCFDWYNVIDECSLAPSSIILVYSSFLLAYFS